ncbi:asparagine synthase (glutamine-hydrolyzing) [Leisingera aquimarina]|uniref:asparagine synthase (glutamine-hydrolyzing) n=2 Tax=Leisingera TaxID=191028 RepID=UPI000429BCA8|nr:asparagine synthase (glutamine-hydrolyzing) [Leisingera aquimarina]
MCGIAGIAAAASAPPLEMSQVRSMCGSIVHRGPDEEGLYLDDDRRVAMGMRRLAIIDLAGGQQPIFNEDRSVATVYNGEIYNYRELRTELEAKGHTFRTNSDTEVIVHLWEEHGAGFVDRLNGMFAIALHDLRTGKLLLARDHLGIKPLYWSATGKHLVFGSEIKALLETGLVERQLDVDSVRQYLSWEYVPAPRTLLQGVYKLEAAQLLLLDLSTGEHELRQYWNVPHADDSTAAWSDAQWQEAVAEQLDVSVRAQLMSEVPLGGLLSGGVDSSLVASAMGPLKAFSIGFNEASYNELPWAQKVGAHLGAEHHVKIIDSSVPALFDRLMHFMDDPIADFSIFPTFLVSELAREHVTVALTGDGGDELFAGYETFLAQRAARTWNLIPAALRNKVIAPLVDAIPPTEAKKSTVNKVKRFVEGAQLDPELSHARWRIFVTEAQSAALLTPEALGRAPTDLGAHIRDLTRRAGDRSDLDRQLYVDLRSYLPDNCLTKVDRMSMAVSLEARVPLLDKDFVSLAYRVPEHLKIGSDGLKTLLKRIAAGRVPRECIYRQKQGFSMPMKTWLKNEYRARMEELLSKRRLTAEGLFNADFVERLKSEHLANRANHSHALWALMVFQDWRERWSV